MMNDKSNNPCDDNKLDEDEGVMPAQGELFESTPANDDVVSPEPANDDIERRGEDEPPPGEKWIYTRYITKKGKRIYHPSGGVFRFSVPI